MDRVMKAKKLLAVLLSLAMIMTMFPVVVFGADEPSDLLPTYQFDFGMTSTPVMAGWTPVTINAQKNPSEASSTMYSAESGYGFLSPISSLISRDRSSGNTYGANQMERDWVGSKDWKFQADVKPEMCIRDRRYTVVQSLCIGCGRCVKGCPNLAMEMGKETHKAHILQDRCLTCGYCTTYCPQFAIRII